METIYVDSSEAYPIWDFYTEQERKEKNYDITRQGYEPIEVSEEELNFITKAFKDHVEAQDLITQKWERSKSRKGVPNKVHKVS